MSFFQSRNALLRLWIVSLLASATCLGAWGYPEPAPIPLSWELKFEPGDLRLYADAETGNAYWYFTYKVTNRTRADRTWAPRFELYTDDGRIQRGGEDVPLRVESQIINLLRNPLLETQNEAFGDIFPGRENAKDGLVIWPAPTSDVTDISIFIQGISGENAKVKMPHTDERVNLWKTLRLDYLIPGDARARGSKSAVVQNQEWIMR